MQKLEATFVTKNELAKTVEDLMEFTRLQFKTFATEITEEIRELRTEMNKELQSMRDDIITFKDEMLGEMSDLRDDVAVTTGYRDLIADHEDRITRLEKKKVN